MRGDLIPPAGRSVRAWDVEALTYSPYGQIAAVTGDPSGSRRCSVGLWIGKCPLLMPIPFRTCSHQAPDASCPGPPLGKRFGLFFRKRGCAGVRRVARRLT